MEQFWLILAGSVLALAGGLGKDFIAIKNARRLKFEEALGHGRVDSYREAYSRAKYVQTMLHDGQYALLIAEHFAEDTGAWFWENRLFLPDRFSDLWIETRTAALKLSMYERQLENPRLPNRVEVVDKQDQLRNEALKLAHDLTESILREVNLRPLGRAGTARWWVRISGWFRRN